jgi:hypothetical protein
LPGFVAPCSTSTVFLNKKLNSEDQVFHGFLHLKPGESEIVDLSPTGFSFANSPLTIYAEGKVSFQDLVLIPFVAPLDTSFFTAYFNPFRSGYINYAEGYADNITGGINEIPCLRIEWRRAYRYVPGATEYDSDFNAERFLDFEILFVDLEDRIDVVFRYLYLGGGMTQDLPLAGIAEGVCVFPGSKEADGLDDLLTRKVSTSNPGEVRFYIKDGKIHGYDEITLFEDGSAELPIRRCIPPMEDLFREVCGMLRIETIKEPGNPEQKKITLYASSSITGGTLNLTKAIPPTFSAETGTTDFFGQPPLENVNGII